MRKFLAAWVFAVGLIMAAPTAVQAHGDPAGDSTAALQAKFDELQPGDTLTLDPGIYRHAGILHVRVPGVHIDGNGATLEATNDATSAFWIAADNVTVSNLNFSAPASGARYYGTDQHKVVVGANGVTVRDITIDGSAGVGIFVGGSKSFRLERVTVRNTRADGIQITAGATDGEISNPTIERTGDDGLAILSYTDELAGYGSNASRNIVVQSPVINGTNWARGIVVAGGENIHIYNISVSHTSLAGVFVASVGAPFFTRSSTGVEVSGGTITDANVTPGFPMGAVAVSSDHRGYSVAQTLISGLTITNTAPQAQRNITVEAANGGTLANVELRDIHIQQQSDLPAVYSNAPADGYILSGFTLNGAPIDVP